jgi:hypothetical protein
VDRKFWVTWAICYLVMLAIIGIAWALYPTDARASAGLAEAGQTLPPRLGLVAIVTIVPLALGAFRLAKIHDRGSPARVVVPVLLAVMVVVAGWLDAFLPDQIGCGSFNIERFGPLDPGCTTAIATRLLAVGEMTVMWVAFALIAIAAERLQRRSAARRTSRTG